MFRGPLPTREGALGAVLASGRPVLLQGDGPALSHYEAPVPSHSFCGVPLRDRQEQVLGALIADREAPFGSADEQVLTSLAGEVVRAMGGELDIVARFPDSAPMRIVQFKPIKGKSLVEKPSGPTSRAKSSVGKSRPS